MIQCVIAIILIIFVRSNPSNWQQNRTTPANSEQRMAALREIQIFGYVTEIQSELLQLLESLNTRAFWPYPNISHWYLEREGEMGEMMVSRLIFGNGSDRKKFYLQSAWNSKSFRFVVVDGRHVWQGSGKFDCHHRIRSNDLNEQLMSNTSPRN